MRYKRRSLDNIDTSNMDTRDVALAAYGHVMSHERICAARWAIIIRLMWAVLGGIGYIAVSQLDTQVHHIIERLR